jgi:hypothetical protein
MRGDFKGTVFPKKLNGGLYACVGWTIYNFYFLVSLKQQLLYVYKENTLNGEISTESVYCISQLIIIQIQQKFIFFLSTLYGID